MSRDCIHPFERRLRLCDPEVATVNSSLGIDRGFVIEGKDRGYKSSDWGCSSPPISRGELTYMHQ